MGGVVGGTVGGVVGGVPGGTGTDVVPFGEGMTRPSCDRQALQRDAYSREALESRVEGTMIVQCEILADGVVQRCKVLKPLPHLKERVVQKLESMKCTPSTFQGKPISIKYTLNFQFSLPK